MGMRESGREDWGSAGSGSKSGSSGSGYAHANSPHTNGMKKLSPRKN